MSDTDDRDLRRLLDDAVADIEPGDRLAAIRARTRLSAGGAAPGRGHRGRLTTVIGAAAAVTLVVGLVGFVVRQTDNKQPAATAEPSQAVDGSADEGRRASFPVYFIGDTARGEGLYREIQTAQTVDPLTYALRQSVQGVADDPDYRSAWPTDFWVAHATEVEGEKVQIGLIGPSVTVRPDGMTRAQARLALQQLVRTAQAAATDDSLPVEFSTGAPTKRVLGIRVGSRVRPASTFTTLSLASLDSPREGQVVDSAVLTVAGAANGYEGTVVIEVVDSGGRAAITEPVIAGSIEDRLFPFEAELDVSELPPGTYTVTASTEDPTAGAEGTGADTDTRTVVIE